MDVLDRAEHLDSYRALCAASFLNSKSREGQSYELAEISVTAAKSLQAAAADLPLLDSCEIAILSSDADGGLPHTRPPNIICLPKGLCSEGPATKGMINTLLHEAIHVHQRQHEAEWTSACIRAGWTPVKEIPQEFRERVRINPDTLANPYWAWQTHHVPLPLFQRQDTPTLSGAPVQWLDLRNGVLYRDPPPSFKTTYNFNVNQPEHPYEVYAELFAEKMYKTGDEILKNLELL